MPRPLDSFLRLELAHIAQIIRDETWLEGERRGRPVSPDDPVVCENVCAVILRIGRELRERCEALAAGDGPSADSVREEPRAA